MGSEYRYDPHRAIQSLLTYSGSIRNLNLSSNPIGRCFTRQKSVVDVVGACMDTIFSRQNYRSSLLRKSFFRGARDVGGAVCGVFQGTSTFPFSSFSHSNIVFFFYSTHYPTGPQIILPHPYMCTKIDLSRLSSL